MDLNFLQRNTYVGLVSSKASTHASRSLTSLSHFKLQNDNMWSYLQKHTSRSSVLPRKISYPLLLQRKRYVWTRPWRPMSDRIQVFQPAHTMNGVELNRLGLQHRILRGLTLKLPTYQETLTALAQQALERELNKTGQLDGKTALHGLSTIANHRADWQSISFWNLAQHTIAQANSSTFYGGDFGTLIWFQLWQLQSLPTVAQDQSFLEAAIQYPQDVFIAAEALRCVPSMFAP